MQTGKRFWNLMGLVFVILITYGLMELSDSIMARQLQLKSQQQLLTKQEVLIRDNHWPENLRAIDLVRKGWMNYLPVEKSPTFAKARLLSEFRDMAKEAGIANLTVSATDSESSDKENAGETTVSGSVPRPVTRFGADKNKENPLPAGVQMIKLTIAGRFDPAAFNKFLKKQTDAQNFAVVERLTVRGGQLELGIRYYWRLEPRIAHNVNTGAVINKPVVASKQGVL